MDKNHIHQLRKKKYKTGQSFFYCIGEDCAFKINADLALNKRSLCNICNKPFNLTPYAMRLAKPHCQDCHKVKEQREAVNVPFDFASQFVNGPANVGVAANINETITAESEISLQITDLCPRCGGLFSTTGGYPKYGPIHCQKCEAEDWTRREHKDDEISLSERLSSITNPTSSSSVISTSNDARSKVDYREYNPDDDEE